MHRENGTTSLRFLALALLLGGLLLLSLHIGEEPAMATDSDSDGISDAMESVLGTDPNDSDSDDDNLDDFDEVFHRGTDPNLADTDTDSLQDDTDPDPLDGGQGTGTTTADRAFDSNLDRSALTGSTPFEGFRVNAITGQLEMVLAKIDFGAGYREQPSQVVLAPPTYPAEHFSHQTVSPCLPFSHTQPESDVLAQPATKTATMATSAIIRMVVRMK